ncbi:unnamed protein product, partial [Symbiodinium necroappetens]
DWLVEDPEFAFEMIPIADVKGSMVYEKTCIPQSPRLRSRALFFMTDTANFHSVMKTSTFAELDKALPKRKVQMER